MLANQVRRARLGVGLGALALGLVLRALACGESGAPPPPLAAAPTEPAAAAASPATLAARAARTARGLALARGELRLEGQVHDPAGHPIGDAVVTLADGRAARTEADGAFAFEDLAPGTYALRAETAELYGEDLAFALTATSDPAEIEVRAGPTLDLLVVDASAAPIAGAHADTLDRAGETDATGHVRLRAIDLALAHLTVSAPGFATATAHLDTGDDPAVTITHTLVMARGSPVSGIVVDAAGAPVGDATVELDAADDHTVVSCTTDARGAWTAPDVASGAYTAAASSERHVASARVTLVHDIAAPQTGIVVRVELGARVTGVVVDPAGAPIADARVSVGRSAAASDATGHFAVTGLEPGTFDLGAYTETASMPSRRIALARAEQQTLRLVLAPSSIAGIVVDPEGHPLPEVRVHAHSDDPNGFGADTTDEHGHFDLGGLPPGTYALDARRDDDAGVRAPTPVRVATGDRRVRVVLPDLGAIRGRVVLAGEPVPYFGVLLTAAGEDPRATAPTPVRDRGGAFARAGLPPGAYTLVLVGPSFARTTLPSIQVGAGATVDLGDIAVEPGAVLRGHVRDARGAPVAGAAVTVHPRRHLAGDEPLDARVSDGYAARTDAAGAYAIAGIAETAEPLEIEASAAGAIATPRPVPPGASEVDLVVRATAILRGTLQTVAQARAFVLAVPLGADGPSGFADLGADGTFAFDPLPVGVYLVEVHRSGAVAPQRVELQAGAPTEVAFPAIPVLARVHVRWPECAFLRLLSLAPITDEEGESSLASAVCEDGAADLADVAPGAYRLCDGDTCKTITVPALSAVTIVGP